jgi:hypothetical protein
MTFLWGGPWESYEYITVRQVRHEGKESFILISDNKWAWLSYFHRWDILGMLSVDVGALYNRFFCPSRATVP